MHRLRKSRARAHRLHTRSCPRLFIRCDIPAMRNHCNGGFTYLFATILRSHCVRIDTNRFFEIVSIAFSSRQKYSMCLDGDMSSFPIERISSKSFFYGKIKSTEEYHVFLDRSDRPVIFRRDVFLGNSRDPIRPIWSIGFWSVILSRSFVILRKVN